MPMVYTPAHINSEIFERLRSSKYTPSASLRSAAPSEREPGGVHSIQPGTCETVGLRAIFIAPTKLKSFYIPPFIGGHSLSHARWACQLPQRGSRERRVPFDVPLINRRVTGDFHRPYETQKILGVAIHRGTLPQSASLTAPSEREPGTPLSGRMPFIVPPGNHDVAGDFHRPYEGRFPFNRVLAKIRGFGRFSSPLRKSVIEI